MKEVSKWEIYEFYGILHLVLEQNLNSPTKMVWCSLNHNADIKSLLQVEEYCIVTPREEWRYIGKVTDNEYNVALANFYARKEEHNIQKSGPKL